MKNIYLVIRESKRGQYGVVATYTNPKLANEGLRKDALKYAKIYDLESSLQFIQGKYLIANIICEVPPKDTIWWHVLKMEVNP